VRKKREEHEEVNINGGKGGVLSVRVLENWTGAAAGAGRRKRGDLKLK